jgi:hypothetical protein
MVVEKERVSLLGVGDLVVTPSAGAEAAVVIAEREHMRTARSTWLEAAVLTPNERDDSDGGYQRALRFDRVTPASTSSGWLSRAFRRMSAWSVLLKIDGRAVTHGGTLYRVVQVGGQHVAIGGIGPS